MPFYRFQRNVWVTAKFDGADHHVILEMWNPDTKAILVRRAGAEPGGMTHN